MVEAAVDDRLARLQGRVFFYQMAHVVFGGEPDASLFAVLASDDCRSALRGLAADGEGSLSAIADFCDTIASDECDRDAEVGSALSAYNRYIAGLGSNRDSHPWESAYTSSRKLLFQVETLEVRNAYRAFGYLPEMYPKVADDHIALECAFLAALAAKTLSAQDDEFTRLVEGQLDFLNNHLLKWIDRYAADLRGEAQGSLYSLVADALAEFASRDAKLLSAIRAEA